MSLQRQHFLLSYLKTLSVGPVKVEEEAKEVEKLCATLETSAFPNSLVNGGWYFTFNSKFQLIHVVNKKIHMPTDAALETNLITFFNCLLYSNCTFSSCMKTFQFLSLLSSSIILLWYDFVLWKRQSHQMMKWVHVCVHMGEGGFS